MSFDVEKEIGRLWKALHAAQSEIGRNYFRWRQVVVDNFAKDEESAIGIGLKAADFFGKDVSKMLLPRLNWLKGEKGFIFGLGRSLANLWIVDGGVVVVEEGEASSEVFIKCTRDPWPTWAKEYNVSMSELVLYRERFFKSILKEVSLFFNIPLGIEIKKSIPKGEGLWLIRLYKKVKMIN